MDQMQIPQQSKSLQINRYDEENANYSQNKQKKNKKKKKKWSYRVSSMTLKTRGIYGCSLWDLVENMCYMRFLVDNQQLFYTTNANRKKIKINMMISQAVKTRSPDQCRSHHQKMLKYHKNIQGVINYIQGLINLSCQSQQITSQNRSEMEIEVFKPLQEQDHLQILNYSLLDSFSELNLQSNFYEYQQQMKIFQSQLQGVEDNYGLF